MSGHFGFVDAMSTLTESKSDGEVPPAESQRLSPDQKLAQSSNKWSKPYNVICDEFALIVEE